MNKQYKHRNCLIEETPTEQFSQMVTITKAPKIRNYFVGRRYITIEKAHTAIELFESERLIRSKEKYVKSQLEDVVIVD